MVPPPGLKVSTAAVPSFSFRPITQTWAPSPVKTLAIPLPMPLVPPVTMTDLSLIDVSTSALLWLKSRRAALYLYSTHRGRRTGELDTLRAGLEPAVKQHRTGSHVANKFT